MKVGDICEDPKVLLKAKGMQILLGCKIAKKEKEKLLLQSYYYYFLDSRVLPETSLLNYQSDGTCVPAATTG